MVSLSRSAGTNPDVAPPTPHAKGPHPEWRIHAALDGAPRQFLSSGLASHRAQLGTKIACLVRCEFDNQTATSFKWDAHHDATTLLGDLERTIARSWLHGGHGVPLFGSFTRLQRCRDDDFEDHYL